MHLLKYNEQLFHSKGTTRPFATNVKKMSTRIEKSAVSFKIMTYLYIIRWEMTGGQKIRTLEKIGRYHYCSKKMY